VQHGDGDDRRDVEPERDVQVPLAALDRAKKFTAKNPTHTTAIAMSIGHSSSAYSLPCVMPSGR
jgi:cytochrome c biogenesis protein CcdA